MTGGSAEALAGGGAGFDQLSVRGKDCGGAEVGEQPSRPVGQGKIGAGALGSDNQDGGLAVVQKMPRAKAGERAADAGAEAAQPLEPRRAALRQGAGEARNLRGGWFAGLETVSGDRTR